MFGGNKIVKEIRFCEILEISNDGNSFAIEADVLQYLNITLTNNHKLYILLSAKQFNKNTSWMVIFFWLVIGLQLVLCVNYDQKQKIATGVKNVPISPVQTTAP